MCVCGTVQCKWNIKYIVQYQSRTQNIEPQKGIVGAVGRWCVYCAVQGVREGDWVHVWTYNVCMTCRCWGGSSTPFAVRVAVLVGVLLPMLQRGAVGEEGLLPVLQRVGLVPAVVGWEISSSYWLHEKRCVVLVGRLIWDFLHTLCTKFCALINIYS